MPSEPILWILLTEIGMNINIYSVFPPWLYTKLCFEKTYLPTFYLHFPYTLLKMILSSDMGIKSEWKGIAWSLSLYLKLD